MLCDSHQWVDLGPVLCILFDALLLSGISGIVVMFINLNKTERK